MKKIPNIFTLLNLLFGCCAIVFALQTESIIINQADDLSTSFSVPERLYFAAICIAIAAFIDFLDGFLARLLKANSAMGKQLDSLSDVVSFGVAPGIIIYQFLRLSLAQEAEGLDASMLWLSPAFVLSAAAAWRLAKFNLATDQADHFKGVPTPAVGLLIASLPLIYWNVNEEWVRSILLNKWILIGLVAALSFLMVSNLPMISFKFKDFSIRNNLPKYIVLLVAIIAIVIGKWLAIPVIFIAYVLVSLLFKNKIA